MGVGTKGWTFADFLRASLLAFPSDDQTLITPINISDGWKWLDCDRNISVGN
jgi:hypothetical protein